MLTLLYAPEGVGERDREGGRERHLNEGGRATLGGLLLDPVGIVVARLLKVERRQVHTRHLPWWVQRSAFGVPRGFDCLMPGFDYLELGSDYLKPGFDCLICASGEHRPC